MAKKNKRNTTNLKPNKADLQAIGVVITRPKEQAEFLIQAIQNSNGVAFNVPCLGISDPLAIDTAQQECRELSVTADYWAFTSPNSVEYAQKFGLDFNLHKPCISIGSGTTKLLKQLTNAEIIQGDKPYTSEKLLETLELLPLADKKISIFSGEGGRRLLADAINDLGADAHYVDVYRRIQPDQIDLTEVIAYGEHHPLVILVSSQEAFENYHKEAIIQDPKALTHTLIVASERLAQFVQSLGYRDIHIADSALGKDLWQKITETFSIIEDSSMRPMNDNDNPNTLEEPPVEQHSPVKAPEPQYNAPKQSHSLSYMALALGAIGIGIGAFAFLQVTQESTNTRALQNIIETQKKDLTSLQQSLSAHQQSLADLKKSFDAERGQSTDFTALVNAQNQQNQNFQALQQRLTALDSAITNLQADSGTSVNRYNQLQDHLTEFQTIVSNLDQSINQIGKMANDTQSDAIKIQNRLTSQLVDINTKISALSTLEERLAAATDIDLLNLSQAKYLLRLVNFKLMFEKDTQESITILNQASERLMATANAKFSETNNLIQSEIIKLKEIPTINHADHATRLQNLINTIPSLKTKSDDILDELKNTFKAEASSKVATGENSETKPWYKNVADKIKPVFVVTQERTEAPDLMTVTDEALLKQSVQLQLSTARLALLQDRAETYQESLKAVRTLLVNYFSQEDDKYHQTLSAIDDLLNVNISTEDFNIVPILKSFEASMLNYRGEGL